MTSAYPEEVDVVVVGGGPSGSTVSSFVAMRGGRVLLLEKEQFPRYQIGESLLPSTVLGICRMLGASAEINSAGFVPKRGGSFRWGTNPNVWNFNFIEALPGADADTVSFQVERMKFDNILLNNARRLGVDVRESCAVDGVLRDGDRVCGVTYVDSAGQERRVNASYVIDASGNTSRIYRNVADTRQYSDFFRNIAIFGYFEDGKRLPPPDSGNVLTAAFPSGWFWYIPLSERLTSVGAVVRHDLADRVQGDREQALMSLIAESPLISDYLADARRVTEGVYGQVRVRRDYSYSGNRFWRPGMALVGDAACFVDPVLSTGVHLATYGGLLAARSVNSVLQGGLDEETAFGEFETRYWREYATFYEFLVSFYDTHMDEKSYFWNAKKLTNYPDSELKAFVSLVGGVSGEGRQVVREKSQAADDWDATMNLRFDPQEKEGWRTGPATARSGWGTKRWMPAGARLQDLRQGPQLVPSDDGLCWTAQG